MSDIKFTDNSDEVLRAMESAKKTALEAIGLVAETYAKKETPVDTGRLRNSITHTVKSDAAYIGTNVEYAPFVEFGSSRNRAHHMLKKAATEHTDEYKGLIRRALENV